ncbi:unnamed protein product [Rotaria magnacalcarata]|uniref:Pectin acetylesterase n=3 Tax=Rotaria magnacalcarata TaxID=392030 RepID=A0A819SQS2_9BILA|nr:unnamed protein product [Rotaria magnacalcarata]CAF1498295.1 unnamed protein product [Rotaria magnacalcarata]CAF2033962.1 unnamed protein product [Rotaria magnacalcarata]CAF4013102.1 unnamed protein product [Rotaria magnacalcarata]CAF4055436.1 unnamed protein product [Rotaria magnacalcarata]
MTSSISSSLSMPSPELIRTSKSHKYYSVEIGIVILFLCLTIPCLIIISLIYRQQTFSPPSSASTTTEFSSDTNFHRISLINYSQARCMDNSVASYYIHIANNNEHSRWLIYFDGGWFCYSNESCEFRRQYSPNFITSNNFNKEIIFKGIFSSFQQFNIIYVPYCSSDLWSGSSNTTHSHGHDIFHAIFHQHNYFSNAKQIVFVGFSAGGIGLLLNLPDLLRKFSPKIDLRVIIDSGWFIDYSNNSHGVSKINQGMNYWNTQISKSCQLTSRHKCLLGSEAIKLFPSNIKIFIIQSLLDLTQLQFDKIHINSYDFSLKLIDNLRQSSNRISIFAPSCPLHGFLFRSIWSKFKIKQRTLSSVLNLWLKRNKSFPIHLIDHHFYSSYCPLNYDDSLNQEIF